MKTTKRLLTTIIVALLVATSTFATEYQKEEAYFAEQAQSTVYNNPSYIRFQKTEAITLRIHDVLHSKKPVTNEQKKAYDTINKKFREWNREYALELEVIAEAWKDVLFNFTEGKAEPTNEQEVKALVDELVQLYDKFFTAIKPVVEKYGKEIDRIEKLVKVYEKM